MRKKTAWNPFKGPADEYNELGACSCLRAFTGFYTAAKDTLRIPDIDCANGHGECVMPVPIVELKR
jgi:hypothetical protein